MQRSALCRSRRELSNAYLLAKFGFDTAENEPSGGGQGHTVSIEFEQGRLIIQERKPRFMFDAKIFAQEGLQVPADAVERVVRANFTGLVLGCIEAKFCK